MKVLKSLLLFLLVPSFSFASGVLIGNSGDGVQVNGKIYLYDLYLNSTYSKPYVGDKISEIIQYNAWRVERLKPLGIDTSLLLRKISDIESLKTGLGVFLLLTIENYSWNFSPVRLPLLPDTSPIIEVERLPLARRVQSNIYFDMQNFAQMDAVQRVALVIHEAFYSLVKVDCLGFQCRQNSISAQSLTGFVFDETSYVCPIYKGDCLGSVREQLIAIDWRASRILGPQIVRMKFVGKDGNVGDEITFTLQDADIAEVRQQQYAPVASELCRRIATNGMFTGGGYSYALVLERNSFALNSKLYRAESDQTAMEIKYRRPRCGYQGSFLSEKRCVEDFSKFFVRWYDKDNMEEGIDCQQ